MDIFIPVGLGFIINLLIFIIAKSLKRTNDTSLLICIIAFFIVLITSLVIGRWKGLGIGVLSIGMLISIFIIKISMIINPRKG
ncbi:YesK-like protein [Lentibacillus halodurans]|uniref:YesK-like protein n=1 Tax=Lentibacillus halodurans TaxID=237679 RepID=A0A1I0Z3P1_9BACI|nr:YesK-like protein [Lentibacillus halodurans]